VQISEALGHDAPWHRLAGSVSLALYCLVGTAAFMTMRESLFGRAAPAAGPAAPAAPPGDPQDRAIAARLDEAMTRGALWRREGLTIGALAETLAVPEHRLRRVINAGLGHRNFAAFLNAHRIAAAQAALADPANAGRTVAAIAFDLGFGSLGPFNRAFKDATGRTPTEFRQQALAETGKS
jgi:AraC-like DNA-binding protein